MIAVRIVSRDNETTMLTLTDDNSWSWYEGTFRATWVDQMSRRRETMLPIENIISIEIVYGVNDCCDVEEWPRARRRVESSPELTERYGEARANGASWGTRPLRVGETSDIERNIRATHRRMKDRGEI